jgi:hypothetical protein
VVIVSVMFMLIEVFAGKLVKAMIVGKAKFHSWVLTIILEHLIQNGMRQQYMVRQVFDMIIFYCCSIALLTFRSLGPSNFIWGGGD